MKLFALLLLSLAAPACMAPVTIVTPPGKAAYTADQVVVRVNELMNAAISAQAATPQGLPTATTRVIVQFGVDADKTLAAVPAGWQASLTTAWASAKAQIGTVTNPLIASLVAALDAVIGGIQ